MLHQTDMVICTRKDKMLETYVLTLLAIWLTITIIGQLTGAYLGFDIIQKIKKM